MFAWVSSVFFGAYTRANHMDLREALDLGPVKASMMGYESVLRLAS